MEMLIAHENNGESARLAADDLHQVCWRRDIPQPTSGKARRERERRMRHFERQRQEVFRSGVIVGNHHSLGSKAFATIADPPLEAPGKGNCRIARLEEKVDTLVRSIQLLSQEGLALVRVSPDFELTIGHLVATAVQRVIPRHQPP